MSVELGFFAGGAILAYLGVNSEKGYLQFFLTFASLILIFIGLAEVDAQGATNGPVGVQAGGLILIVFFMLWLIKFIVTVWDAMVNMVNKW